ncbi:MAG: phosphoribosylglycinamide formyltransferase [Ardenticatenales bacterium]|nr:phosphoribosylglycinamide formyltransferase [Ardenticatenales bacterium]
MSKEHARLAVLLSGQGSNFQAILDAIDAGTLPAEVVIVATNRADAYGLQRATARAIPTLCHSLAPYRESGRSRADYDAELAQKLLPYRPDWVVLAGWMHLLSMSFLQHFPQRVVNLHPALPGQFPGTHAIKRAFAAFQQGEISETGIMVHLVPDERVDEGPVLATTSVPILPDDTLAALEARMHAAEHDLLVCTLAQVIQ